MMNGSCSGNDLDSASRVHGVLIVSDSDAGYLSHPVHAAFPHMGQTCVCAEWQGLAGRNTEKSGHAPPEVGPSQGTTSQVG